jgi:MFS family permease
LWIAGLSSVVSASATLIAIFTVDRIGRKPYLVWGSVAQAIFFMIIAILLGVSPPQDKTLGTAAVVMLFLWFWTNSCSWLGQSWAYPTEILPLRIREKGLGLGNVCYWLSAFMVWPDHCRLCSSTH